MYLSETMILYQWARKFGTDDDVRECRNRHRMRVVRRKMRKAGLWTRHNRKH